MAYELLKSTDVLHRRCLKTCGKCWEVHGLPVLVLRHQPAGSVSVQHLHACLREGLVWSLTDALTYVPLREHATVLPAQVDIKYYEGETHRHACA